MVPLADGNDLCAGICWAFLLTPPLLLAFYLVVCIIRLWNTRPTDQCPRCRAAPRVLDVHNVCWHCGCEYDKWGNLLKEPSPPPQLDALDLARFDAKRKQADPDDDRYHRPGLTQEPTP
jgi:hypothetical protein